MAALGITVAPLNIRLRPDEIAVCLRKARPSAVLTSGALAGLLEGLGGEFPNIRDWIAFEPVQGFDDYEAILAESSPDQPPPVAQGADIHHILFTSGTTRQPQSALV